MVVVMRTEATEAHIEGVLERLHEHALKGHLVRGEERTIIGVVGAMIPPTLREEMEHFPGVAHTIRITQPYKLAAREFRPHDTVVDVRGIPVGGGACVVIAGPCTVESEAQIVQTAHAVREAGATMLRGGAFKPRTSPTPFAAWAKKGYACWHWRGAKPACPLSPK